MDTFSAGVQYDDFKGTIAADISDHVGLANYLRSVGAANTGDRVIAFRIGSNENRGVDVSDVSLVAYLLDSDEFEASPQSVRAVEVSITPGKALSFFKRFDLVATQRGVDLSQTTVDGPHYG
ncbi:hypothetical protein [Sphingomonas parapaucimobilis]|uniref:hypothetical protein n=1 Tax=Sphingomonas parapaucimobilis TaxID=28213 RepID=UPI00321B8DCF